MLLEADYRCGACGERIVVEVDPSAGTTQEYVEDCPVCCRANLLHVRLDGHGGATIEAELE